MLSKCFAPPGPSARRGEVACMKGRSESWCMKHVSIMSMSIWAASMSSTAKRNLISWQDMEMCLAEGDESTNIFTLE